MTRNGYLSVNAMRCRDKMIRWNENAEKIEVYSNIDSPKRKTVSQSYQKKAAWLETFWSFFGPTQQPSLL